MFRSIKCAYPSIVVLAVTACGTISQTSNDITAIERYGSCGVDRVEYERLMSLNYSDFDQDLFGGWRAIDYQDGCSAIAGDLILDYIKDDRRTLTNPQLKMLYWHAGQMRAYVGDASAISLFEKTYDQANSAQNTPWNLYVMGTIAFLKRDKSSLTIARDELAKLPVPLEEQQARQDFLDKNPNVRMPEGYVTQPMNLPALNSLVRCFDQPYKIAYQQCPKSSMED